MESVFKRFNCHIILCPAFKLLTVDVWEHAYYLKHYNERAAYISDWFHIVNWDQAAANYQMLFP